MKVLTPTHLCKSESTTAGSLLDCCTDDSKSLIIKITLQNCRWIPFVRHKRKQSHQSHSWFCCRRAAASSTHSIILIIIWSFPFKHKASLLFPPGFNLDTHCTLNQKYWQRVSNCPPTWTESFLSSFGRILYVYTHVWYLWLGIKCKCLSLEYDMYSMKHKETCWQMHSVCWASHQNGLWTVKRRLRYEKMCKRVVQTPKGVALWLYKIKIKGN